MSDIAKKFIDSGSISTLDLLLPRQVNTGPLILKQMQVRCLDSYLPQVGSAVPDVQSSWLWSTVAMSDHGRALAYSFSALCLTRVGIVLKDESLIKQGRCQYSLALISLQQALYDPELAFQDRTLAAIRTLSIYEVCLSALKDNMLFLTIDPAPRTGISQEPSCKSARRRHGPMVSCRWAQEHQHRVCNAGVYGCTVEHCTWAQS